MSGRHEVRRLIAGVAVLAPALWIGVGHAQEQSATAAGASTTAPSLAGWSMFAIKKTPAELAETLRLKDDGQLVPRTAAVESKLPPQHDVLRISTGLGYLQGAD